MNTQLTQETDKLLDLIHSDASKKELAEQCFVLDKVLVKEFVEQGYYTSEGQLSDRVLEKLKADTSLETIFEKLRKAKEKQSQLEPWKAVDNWLENAMKIMHEFLEEYPIGYLDEMYIDEGGIVRVDIGCATGDNKDGKWLEQKKKLEEAGLILEERKFSSRCFFTASGNNVEKIVELFTKRHSRVDVNVNVRFGEIEAIKLEMAAEAIEAFKLNKVQSVVETQKDKPNELLTEYDVANLKNEIKSFWNAMQLLSADNIDRVLVCQNLELSLSLISKMVGANTQISDTVAKRYEAEKAAIQEYCKISTDIGNTFNPKDMRDVVVRMVRDMQYTLHDKIGLDVKDIKIYPSNYGFVWAQLKYVIPRTRRQMQPRPQDNALEWDIHPETKQLLSTDRNRRKILEFFNEHDIRVTNMLSTYNTVAHDFIIQTFDVQIMDLARILPK